VYLVGSTKTNVKWNGASTGVTFGGMVPVQFPPPAFRIKQERGKDCLFDALRKRWVVLTPEEWVRQNFVQYLLQVLHYPAGLIALEKEMTVGEMKKRFDMVVCDKDAQPWMLIECKAMQVPLSTQVSEQALRYNQTMQVNYLVVTNGTFTRCFQLQPQVVELEAMPEWE
jgi:hypothetical protein